MHADCVAANICSVVKSNIFVTASPQSWRKHMIEVVNQFYCVVRVLVFPGRFKQRCPCEQTHLHPANITMIHRVRYLLVEGGINIETHTILQLLVPLFWHLAVHGSQFIRKGYKARNCLPCEFLNAAPFRSRICESLKTRIMILLGKDPHAVKTSTRANLSDCVVGRTEFEC